MTLVLLPGMDGTGTLFAPFLAALGDEFDVRVVRYPGDQPLGYSALEAIAQRAIPDEGPYVLLGESFSGPIAVSLAAYAPERLRGLILCCSFVKNPRPSLAGLRSLVNCLPLSLVPGRLLGHLLFGKFSTAMLCAALSRSLAEVTPATLAARLEAVLSVDVSSQLLSVTAPTLYLLASDDRVVPRAASQFISQISPNTQLAQLEAPHCLLQTVPSEAAGVVKAFVHRVMQQRPSAPAAATSSQHNGNG
jgi:pimeloyl-ACP methyl ester carboxylesterase